MSNNNRQVQRTRQTLQNALIALICEKPYEAIEIQEIAERANTARVTFYRHYHTKDELLIDYLDQLYHQLEAVLIHNRDENLLDLRQPPPNLPLFELIDQNRPLYRKLIYGPMGTVIQQRVRQYIVEHILHVCGTSMRFADLPLGLIANHMASVTIGNLGWWLAEDDGYTAEQMARLTHSLGIAGALAIFGRLDLLTLPEPA